MRALAGCYIDALVLISKDLVISKSVCYVGLDLVDSCLSAGIDYTILLLYINV